MQQTVYLLYLQNDLQYPTIKLHVKLPLDDIISIAYFKLAVVIVKSFKNH